MIYVGNGTHYGKDVLSAGKEPVTPASIARAGVTGRPVSAEGRMADTSYEDYEAQPNNDTTSDQGQGATVRIRCVRYLYDNVRTVRAHYFAIR